MWKLMFKIILFFRNIIYELFAGLIWGTISLLGIAVLLIPIGWAQLFLPMYIGVGDIPTVLGSITGIAIYAVCIFGEIKWCDFAREDVHDYIEAFLISNLK